jgi:hypothetical protein
LYLLPSSFSATVMPMALASDFVSLQLRALNRRAGQASMGRERPSSRG